MAISTVKRLAAEIMRVGVNKVRIDPDATAKAEEALTRNDVRNLIDEGVVYRSAIEGRRKRTGKKRSAGTGNKKGTKNARNPSKAAWMERVRAQRKYLRELVADKSLKEGKKREIYMKVKSGVFRSRKTMHTYLQDNNFLNEKKK